MSGSCTAERMKLLGPDGFNMGFVQKFWCIIKEGMVELFKELHEAGSFMKCLNSTFMVLIAMVEGVVNIKEFWPIFLLGCIHKLIVKILAKRMIKLLGQMTGECQHALIERR